MKMYLKSSIYLLLLLLQYNFMFGVGNSTETFESQTVGSNSFTNGSVTFNLTPTTYHKVFQLIINAVGYYYLSSNRYISNYKVQTGDPYYLKLKLGKSVI